MKLLLVILTLLPSLCFGQRYFKCDRKKKVEITLADNPIWKISKSEYATSGNLLIRWGQATITCDSAVCDCKSKTIMACGHLKYTDDTKVGVFNTDTLYFDLNRSMLYGGHVR